MRGRPPERQRDPALHVGGPGAVEPLTVGARRLVLGVGHDGVEVAKQQQPAASGPVQRRQHVRGAAAGRARQPLYAPVRKEALTKRDRLLGARDLARGSGDRDQLHDLVEHARCDARGERGQVLPSERLAQHRVPRRAGLVEPADRCRVGRAARDLRVLSGLAQDLGDEYRRSGRASRASRSRSAR